LVAKRSGKLAADVPVPRSRSERAVIEAPLARAPPTNAMSRSLVPFERWRCRSAHTRGDLWPQDKHADASRPLEMCTLNVWTYRWEQLTVSVPQLAKSRKQKSGGETRAPHAPEESPPAK